jgi:hypothetical protein
VISAGDHEFSIRKLRSDQAEGFNHELESFVRSPFSKRKNAMNRIAAAREIRELRPPRENAMRPNVHIVSPIFVIQDLSISRHQDGDRVRHQKHASCDCACEAIEPFVANSNILQVDRIDQVMQRHMCITATEARQQRSHEPGECHNRFAAEGTKEQIEPDHIWLQPMQRSDDAKGTSRIIE